jgi:hypothetical protein
MNIQTAQLIFDKIEASQLVDLKRDVYHASLRYTSLRCAWRLATAQERQDLDSARARAQDALIDTFNIMSREQAKLGEDCSWRRLVGVDRKEIGDMGGYLVLFLALSGR